MGAGLDTSRVLPQEEQYCPAVLYFLPFLNPPAIHEINTGFHSSRMNELQAEISPLGPECVEDAEWPHFLRVWLVMDPSLRMRTTDPVEGVPLQGRGVGLDDL